MIQKQPGEKLGISIRGGAKGHAGNPFDATDEGIFISKVSETTSCLMLYTTILQLSDFFVKFFFFFTTFEGAGAFKRHIYTIQPVLRVMKQSTLFKT